jgi:hypothetical protein
MTDAPATLKLFFCEDAGRPIGEACDLKAAHDALEVAARSVPGPLRPGVATALAGAIDEVFQVSLGDVLAASWKKAAAVQDALEATRQDRSKTVVVPFMDHRITSKHQPHVEVMFSGKSLQKLVFDITLALELKGVQIQVREGRIVGVGSGACQGQGVFALAGQEIIKRATPAFPLPGRLAFNG